jgi:murein DD-endopeptidase MepM/ murein hydrolase activator NlpD
MRRLLLVAIVALVATGAASADTFEVVGDQPAPPAASAATALPSALAPNESGVMLPELLVAPVAPQQLGWADLLPVWQAAGQAYGIPWSVLAAINKIESDFGRNMGPSSAGAIGWMQFMPDTWARWGVDANGDGLPDPWNAEDAIYSAARYLAATGGATDISSAVFSYNHAQWYVDEVLQLAQQYAGGSADFGPALEAAQADLEAAKQAVLDANQRVLDAQAQVTELQARADELLQKATSETLFSDRLATQKLATLADVEVQAAQAGVTARQAELQAAEDALAAARDRASGASFAPGSGQVLGSPSYAGGYVFPVAGGAGVVRVGHTHHDYPAADIAAPEGTQLYALSDGTVQDAFSEPSGRCGIGFTIATTDGLVWTYCHLAYLEPTVVAGAQLAAGQPVGLVGQTGHATGPHLHLQLQPASAYPQDEPWFQSFAGSAFTWSDGFQLETASGPVFEVVDDGSGSPRTLESASSPIVLFTTSGA